MLVRFPDGEIRYGKYHGTSDLPYHDLTTERDEWTKLQFSSDTNRVEADDQVVPVEIYSKYGGGSYWSGTATKWCLVDTGFSLDENNDIVWPKDQKDGEPAWAREGAKP